MNNTYLDSLAGDVYPFVPGTRLPFSYGCISDIRVSYHADDGVSVISNVRATAVGITDGSVTVTLCHGQQQAFLCTLTGSLSGGCSVVRADLPGIQVSAFLATGSILPDDIGSYVTDLPLEGACVVRMPGAVYSQTGTVKVNGVTHVPDECLRINTTGYFRPSVRTGSPGAELLLPAEVPSGAVSTSADGTGEYAKVSSVNGRTVVMQGGSVYTGVLFLQLQCPSLTAAQKGSQTQKAGLAATFMSYSLSGSLSAPSFPRGTEVAAYTVTVPGQGGGQPSTVTVNVPGNVPQGTVITNPDDEACSSVIVTLAGTRQIPSCYSRADDDAPDGLA